MKHIFLSSNACCLEERLYFCVVKHKNNRITSFFKDNKIDFRRITKMKKIKNLFRHFGEADKNIWGYVML